MDIVYSYKKKVRELGQPYEFEDSEPILLVNIQPDDRIRKSYYIEKDPCHVGVQTAPELSEHVVNTNTKNYSSSGMLHIEGGWPKDVNAMDVDAKKRHQKKVEKDDSYVKSALALSNEVIKNLCINTALNVHENYFETDEISGIEDDQLIRSTTTKPTATVLTILKDPSEHKRIVNHIAWANGDSKKLAAAYFVPQNDALSESMEKSSYIWDIRNPNSPELVLTPGSPLSCLEFNPKDSTCILGGARNGCLYVFDTRRGSNPVEYSHSQTSHKDPVYSVRWIQSKQFTECVSISSDSQVLFWDIRNLAEPLERNVLEITQSKIYQPQKFGALCMDYDTSYSTSKLLIGSDRGQCLIWNRKARKGGKEKVERVYLGHHSSAFSVQRCPFNPKYFLSIGDWTARIYHDDIWKNPLIETKYSENYLTDGCWSPTRPGVFFTTSTDGSFSVWDILHSHSKPVVSLQLTSSLHCVSTSNGKHLAVGDRDGGVSYIELSDDLSGYFNGAPRVIQDEKNAINDMLDRETRREKALEQKVKPVESTNSSSLLEVPHERFVAPNEEELNKYFEEALQR
ncbi:hypothetical protein FDP41_005130 [Naegleria fowleri]|uniref:Uncharacterized protein n=1 Tax=Naegleria fowleri TaxID=5763 RepID=A0A6A5BD25_NAEFO|nr:uncharacterized protein FDP41_005130 [Naegleria fowleri]KAF0975803.1 hypothetical protein FDP41_005130 [Naegleria fowleri]CAG4719080.1 unnamed protein product [Naegleria fowleri]